MHFRVIVYQVVSWWKFLFLIPTLPCSSNSSSLNLACAGFTRLLVYHSSTFGRHTLFGTFTGDVRLDTPAFAVFSSASVAEDAASSGDVAVYFSGTSSGGASYNVVISSLVFVAPFVAIVLHVAHHRRRRHNPYPLFRRRNLYHRFPHHLRKCVMCWLLFVSLLLNFLFFPVFYCASTLPFQSLKSCVCLSVCWKVLGSLILLWLGDLGVLSST
jgi:hypothetical protein